MWDVALDPYTSHGHDVLIKNDEIILKEDLQGFTVYGFKNDNLMAKNALLDISKVTN